jgi:drug/metabolite transporter, DME family
MISTNSCGRNYIPNGVRTGAGTPPHWRLVSAQARPSDQAAASVHRRAVLAVLGASVLFGTTGTAQELGPDGTTPLGVGALRIAVGSVALWCFARRLPSVRTLVRHPVPFALGALGVAVYQPAFFAGISRCGVALGTILALGSGPLFAGSLEWAVWRRLPTRPWAVGTALSVAGGTLLVAAGGGDARPDAVGITCALAAGFGYAVYALAAKVLIERGEDSTVALAWPFTLGAMVLLIVAAGEPLGWAVTADGMVMLLHLGVLTVGLAYYLYGRGLRTLDTSTAVTLTLAEPLTAALAAMIFLDERLGVFGWIGAALVIAGLAVAGGVGGVGAAAGQSLRARDGATRGASSGILG